MLYICAYSSILTNGLAQPLQLLLLLVERALLQLGLQNLLLFYLQLRLLLQLTVPGGWEGNIQRMKKKMQEERNCVNEIQNTLGRCESTLWCTVLLMTVVGFI